MAGFDIIVIGAGLNGLVTANYLAKAGKDALRKPAGWGGAVARSTNVICSISRTRLRL